MHLWPHRALKPWSTGPLERRSGATQDAVASVALITAAKGKAKSIIKHGGERETLSFPLGNLPKNRCCSNRGASRSCKWKSPKVLSNTGVRETLSFPLGNLPKNRCCSNRCASRSCKWKNRYYYYLLLLPTTSGLTTSYYHCYYYLLLPTTTYAI
jgi:hypothetical protein